MPFTATLMGGPKHGKVVEIVGIRYQFAEALPERLNLDRAVVRGICAALGRPVPEWARRQIRYGIYEWDYDHDNPTDETKYVGIWKGYKEKT